MKSMLAMLAMVGLCLAVSGCNSGDNKTKAENKSNNKTNQGGGGHSHKHGPNGEVLFEIKELGIAGELIVSKTSHKVTIAFCDDHGREPMPVKLEKIAIIYEDQTYDLKAEKPDADGKSTRYSMSDDSELAMIAMNRPDLEVKMGDKEAKVRLPRPH